MIQYLQVATPYKKNKEKYMKTHIWREGNGEARL